MVSALDLNMKAGGLGANSIAPGSGQLIA